jgi:hypothetical protein
MAEHGAIPSGEDGRHPPSVPADTAVADREHTTVKRMQHAAGDATVDRATPDSGGEQLGTSDHAVLASRKLGDEVVRRTSRAFATAEVAKTRLDRHAGIVAPRASRITTQTQRFC